MILIIATVCSILVPNGKQPCRDITLSFAEEAVDGNPMPLNQMSCFLQGQLEISKWQEAHPNWQLAKWHCEQSKRGQRKIDL